MVDGAGVASLSFLPCFFFLASLLLVLAGSLGAAVIGSAAGVAGAVCAGADMLSVAVGVCCVVLGGAAVDEAGACCCGADCGAVCAETRPEEASSAAVAMNKEVRFIAGTSTTCRGRPDRNSDAQIRKLTPR